MDSCFRDIYHLDNTLEDFNPNVGQNTDTNEKILTKIEELTHYIVKNVLESNINKYDCNIYNGYSGIAYMFWYLSQQQPYFSQEKRTEFLKYAKTLIVRALRSLSKQTESDSSDSDIAFNPSVIKGNAGIVFIACLIFDSLSEESLRNHYLDGFVRLAGYSAADKFMPNGSDSYFEGRAGYISASIVINKSLKTKVISNELLSNLAFSVLESGRRRESKKFNSPLIYSWDSILYLGNSLGFSGILSALISVSHLMSDKVYESNVRKSIDFVMSYQRCNGTFPYAANSIHHSKESEETINWCNGSSGLVWLLAKAYNIWKDDKYLKACLKCQEIVWKRGLSQNYPGLCHGISGNGYCFLLLHRLTNDPKYLHRAREFAKFILSREYEQISKEWKNPFGLFEGYSGVVCYLLDVLNASHNIGVGFPLFFDIF